MRKSILFLVLIFALILCSRPCFAGHLLPPHYVAVKDTTPPELLDYRLSRSEFLYYYGIDDTAKALINMFYRKRKNAFFNIFTPVGCFALSSGGNFIMFPYSWVVLNTPGTLVFAAGVLVYAGRGIVQRIRYSRQNLLYMLVDRENGYPIPANYLKKIKTEDFYRK